MEHKVIFEEPTSGLKVQTTILNNCIKQKLKLLNNQKKRNENLESEKNQIKC